ncbi:unnamed protein product [Dictyota dichotoma]
MNLSYAFFYSVLLFFILLLISFYIFQKIINIQLIEIKIKKLQQKDKNVDLNCEDLYKLGQLFLQKRLFNKALLLFHQALLLWDLNDKIGLASLINTIGVTYFQLKKYKNSIYYYKIAIKIIPDYILILKNLAFVYESTKKFSKAKKYYNDCLIIQPNSKFFIDRLNFINRQLKLTLVDN